MKPQLFLGLTIAERSNPLGWLSGSFSAKDVYDATNDVADAISRLVQSSVLTALWASVVSQSAVIDDAFTQNEEYLESVITIVFESSATNRTEFEKSKNIFLQQYTDYNPQVSSDDIVELTTTWDKLANEACVVLDAVDSATGKGIKQIAIGENYCVDLPILAQRMGNLYLNMYDYQFDLMDSLATYMRSRVTLDAAKEINEEFNYLSSMNPDSEATFYLLQLMGGLTYITYKSHIFQAVSQYCNILEYRKGGIHPKECTGPETDLSILVSASVPVCISESHTFYYAPTHPSKLNSTLSISLSELFAGETVEFKIPDSQWLIDNGWITEEERDYAFFVENFEVYLPTKTKHPKRLYTIVDPALHIQVIPNGTEYMITPHIPLVHEYILGPQRSVCHDQKSANPYTACESDPTSYICQVSQKNTRYIFPSIYSQWAITLKGGEDLPLPNPATDLKIIFGLQICKTVINKSYEEFWETYDREKRNVNQNDCCLSGEFRPNTTADCEPCPSGSHSALAGYYCEKDQIQ